MKSSKLIFLFLAYAFVCSLNVQSAGAAQWEKACEGDGFKSRVMTYFDFFYPEKCIGSVDVGEDLSSLNKEEKIDRFKKQIKEKEEEKLDVETQMAWLDDTDEAEIKEAKEKIKKIEAQIVSLKEDLGELDPSLAPQKASKKGKKKPKAPTKVLKEMDTFKYYELDRINGDMNIVLDDIISKLDIRDTLDYANLHCKVFVVTDPKQFASLKGKEAFSPADNISVDRKDRSILVCATPGIKSQLDKTLCYGVVSLVLKEYMAVANPTGELCDAFRVGICAYCSQLNVVVEPNKIISLPYLMENKLLLSSEMFLPPKMDDLERKLYFTRQARAIVSNIFDASESKFAEYIKSVKGGNSGFRNSFQNLYVSDQWAANFDDFCNGLKFRVFYPLTKEPMTNPEALAAWKKAISEKQY